LVNEGEEAPDFTLQADDQYSALENAIMKLVGWVEI